jgi:hypothetical protein
MEQALKLIKPYTDALEVYPVSTVVGNVKNDVPDCIKPIELKASTIKTETGMKPGALDKFFKKEPQNKELALKEEKKEILADIKKERLPIKPDPLAEVTTTGSKRKRSDKGDDNSDVMNSDDDEQQNRPTKRIKTQSIKKERK